MKKMSILINSQEYTIIKEIGKGAFGKVFKLEKNNKYFALKQIPISELADIDRLKKEVNILSKFDSDNIIKYLSYSNDQKYFNILMEYGGDLNLKQFIKKYKDKSELIEEENITKIIMQIYLGLREIHQANIIHRDLTPENIFINENDMKIKIGDFGVSKILGPNYNYAKSGTGKMFYNAPEILKGQKYNKSIDIYAFGCIIYELFTLNEYFLDNFYGDKKAKINTDIYNPKWQELIDSLCKEDYHQRSSIDGIYEKLKKFDSDKKLVVRIFHFIMSARYNIFIILQKCVDKYKFKNIQGSVIYLLKKFLGGIFNI